jgi:predicted metal-dependent hydrolase
LATASGGGQLQHDYFEKPRRQDLRRLVGPDCVPGLHVPVSIRISERARRVGLRIDSAERKVELILPRGVSERSGLRFLAAKRAWVTARLKALPQAVPFVEGAVVPLLGVAHLICRELDPAAPPVKIVDGEIRVRGDPAHLARRVRDHLVAAARAELVRERASWPRTSSGMWRE